jgi:hypothetical protein
VTCNETPGGPGEEKKGRGGLSLAEMANAVEKELTAS